MLSCAAHESLSHVRRYWNRTESRCPRSIVTDLKRDRRDAQFLPSEEQRRMVAQKLVRALDRRPMRSADSSARSTLLQERRQALITAAVTGQLDIPGGSMSSVSEKLLEDEISAHLVAHGGYRECKVGTEPEWRPDFDATVGLDTVELFRFIELTQGPEWEKLVKAHGGDEELAYRKFTQRLAQQIDERGTVDVLRHGIRDQNVEIRLSYRKPAFGVAPELVGALRRQPPDGHAPASVRPGLQQDDRPLPVRQRHPGRDGRAQEPAHRPEHRARDRAVPHRPRSEERHARAARARPLRGRPRLGGDDHQARGQGDALPAVQPRPQPRARATRRIPTATRPPTSGSASGPGTPGSTSSHRFIHVERPEKGSVSARRAAETVIFPRYHQWDAVLKLEADARSQRRRPLLPRPALGRLGQVQHDRLDCASALDAPHAQTTARSSTRSSSSPTASSSTASSRTRSTSSSTRAAWS